MDFVTWYRARHAGRDPFPWQERLARRISADDWPDAVTTPTGAGKTAIVAVWLWALEQGLAVPRRLVYLVDRRLIVDSTSDYARGLAAASPLPVHVATLRGGLVSDEVKLDPLQPAILVSTVDQAGSRLLFSGYGVSWRTAPIHAALLANDVVWVLDEVHLAQPLLQTLARVASLRGSAIGLPFRLLVMSATWGGENVVGLDDADWRHPVLKARLTRPKPLRLRELKVDADLIGALVAAARELRTAGADVIGVVANRVRDARAVHRRLCGDGDAVLLTGRIRPADRDALLAEVLPRIRAGSRGARGPLFVVATSTIEVGADLDFDALVTESAAFSALCQRAGRLNRLGELPSAPMIIIHPKRSLAELEEPRKAAQRQIDQSIRWLSKHKVKDFGISALLALPEPPSEPPTGAPELLPAHLDVLSRTSARPGIDVAPWLHGWPEPERMVFLCWRRDAAAETVAAMPPGTRELLEVPLYELRRLGAEALWRWDGSDAEPIAADAARPGDTLVVDSKVGGCDRYGWDPSCDQPVPDLADDARRMRVLGDDGADWRALARAAGLARPGRVLPYPGGALVLTAAVWSSRAALRAVPLRAHLQAVGRRARQMAEAVALDPELVQALGRAGAGHDTGKRDPRWQATLAADPAHPLAKGPRWR